MVTLKYWTCYTDLNNFEKVPSNSDLKLVHIAFKNVRLSSSQVVAVIQLIRWRVLRMWRILLFYSIIDFFV